jgi:hypothetical protein
MELNYPVLDARSYLEIPAFFFLTLSYCFFFSFYRVATHSVAPTTWPAAWLVFVAVFFLNPLPVLRRRSRWWLIKVLWRVCTPGYSRVEVSATILSLSLTIPPVHCFLRRGSPQLACVLYPEHLLPVLRVRQPLARRRVRRVPQRQVVAVRLVGVPATTGPSDPVSEAFQGLEHADPLGQCREILLLDPADVSVRLLAQSRQSSRARQLCRVDHLRDTGEYLHLSLGLNCRLGPSPPA